jgi:hypothetical protein
MKTTKFNGIVHVARNTWRETVTRMMRAEQTREEKMKLVATYAAVTKQLLDSSKDLAFEVGRQHGQEQVLRLIARWGKARPLEGMGGADMAEALRKVLTPTIAPYTDYKGITQAVADGDVKLTDIPICDAKSGEWSQYRFRQKKWELYR